MFQSDIYPPTTGLKAGTIASEWFGGKTALPPKISLESVYDGGAPQEVASEYKPQQMAPAQPSPAKAEPPKPAPEPTPAPVTSRGPPPSMNDSKDSLAAGAAKFADRNEASDNESASSFEEVSKSVDRRNITATRQEEKVMGQTGKESEPTKTTSAPAAAPAQAKSIQSPAESTPAPTATASATAAPSSGGPAGVLRDALVDIKSQLEHQNRVMADQSDQIAILLREVGQLKTKLGSQGPSDREKDERIRQLELELEEARS